MRKKYDQIKILLLVVLFLISPALWLALGNIPVNFEDKNPWLYLITFLTLAFAIFVAFEANHKK